MWNKEGGYTMKVRVIAQCIDRSSVTREFHLGNSILDEFGRMNARTFNRLKRKALKLKPDLKRGEYMRLIAKPVYNSDQTMYPSFDGYPAFSYVIFRNM